MNVFYLGPSGSFSAIVAEKQFSSSGASIISCDDFDHILRRVLAEPHSIGILPIENSITSNVHENVDSLFRSELHIVGEAYLQVTLHAIGSSKASIETITTVYSHPKALQQCSRWITERNLHAIPCRSTSEAIQQVLAKSDPALAVIGAAVLASLPGCTVLASDIGNVKQNTTRFVFISRSASALSPANPDKLSISFTALHQPGSLAIVLSSLAMHGVNLTKIVSQPIPGSDFEYNFWIDLECEPEKVSLALKTMEENTQEFSVIGSYARGKKFNS